MNDRRPLVPFPKVYYSDFDPWEMGIVCNHNIQMHIKYLDPSQVLNLSIFPMTHLIGTCSYSSFETISYIITHWLAEECI